MLLEHAVKTVNITPMRFGKCHMSKSARCAVSESITYYFQARICHCDLETYNSLVSTIQDENCFLSLGSTERRYSVEQSPQLTCNIHEINHQDLKVSCYCSTTQPTLTVYTGSVTYSFKWIRTHSVPDTVLGPPNINRPVLGFLELRH